MTKFLSGIFSFFVSCLAYAQTREAPPDAPLPETNVIGIILFLLLFVGLCVGYGWYVWRGERKRRREEELEEKHGGAPGPEA